MTATSAPDPVPVRITAELLRRWPLPAPGKDKEARGRVLVVGGAAHSPGAVLLASEAVLRAGGGKLQVATAEPVAAPLAVAVPEAFVLPLETTSEGNIAAAEARRIVELAEGVDSILIGPGFSSVQATRQLLAGVVPQLDCPVVIDGVASAYVGAFPEALRHLDGRCVLTLNPSELAKTVDVDVRSAEADPLRAARTLAAVTAAVVLCGGQGKVVAAPDGRSWTCGRGGPGLGVSGSGDVQAGLVAGLLGRGADPAQAACWGSFLHGTAGDQLAADVGTVGFLAREIPGRVPALLDRLGRPDWRHPRPGGRSR